MTNRIDNGTFCLLSNLARVRTISALLRNLFPSDALGHITDMELATVSAVTDSWIARMEAEVEKASEVW